MITISNVVLDVKIQKSRLQKELHKADSPSNSVIGVQPFREIGIPKLGPVVPYSNRQGFLGPD